MENKRERKETIMRLMEVYGFADEQALWDFGQDMQNPKVKISKITHIEEVDDDYDDEPIEPHTVITVLYTDGDGGYLELSQSEMFDDDGFQIRPVLCSYADMTHGALLSLFDIWEYFDEQEHHAVFDV